VKSIAQDGLLQEESGTRPLFVVGAINLTGHRIQYLTSLFKRLSMSEAKIVLVLVSKIKFDLSASQIRELQAIDFEYIDDCKKPATVLSVARRLANQNAKSEILFWDADNWIFPLLLFSKKSKLLFMRPYLSQKSLQKVVILLIKWCAILFFHYIRRFKVGILGVPLQPHRLMPSLWVDDSLLIAPDLPGSTQDKNDLSVLSDIPANARVILMPGFITARKNPKLLINAIQIASKSISANIVLVFAGKTDVECSTLITSSDYPNIRHINRYLSDDEFRLLLQRADVVVLPYTNQGTSAIAIESLAHGKPVILGESKLWKAAAASSNGLMHLCDLNSNAISLAVSQILSKNMAYPPQFLTRINRPTVLDFFKVLTI
jgi:glycosyltransferase involved in cell wall biosynthesis